MKKWFLDVVDLDLVKVFYSLDKVKGQIIKISTNYWLPLKQHSFSCCFIYIQWGSFGGATSLELQFALEISYISW